MAPRVGERHGPGRMDVVPEASLDAAVCDCCPEGELTRGVREPHEEAQAIRSHSPPRDTFPS